VSGTVNSSAGDILVQAYHNADDSAFVDSNTVYAAVDNVNIALGVSAFETDVNANALRCPGEARHYGTLQALNGDVVVATRSGNRAEAALDNHSGAGLSITTGADPQP